MRKRKGEHARAAADEAAEPIAAEAAPEAPPASGWSQHYDIAETERTGYADVVESKRTAYAAVAERGAKVAPELVTDEPPEAEPPAEHPKSKSKSRAPRARRARKAT